MMREYYLCIFRLFQSSFPYLILQSLIFLFPFFLSNFPLNAHICLSFTKTIPLLRGSLVTLGLYTRCRHYRTKAAAQRSVYNARCAQPPVLGARALHRHHQQEQQFWSFCLCSAGYLYHANPSSIKKTKI